MFLKSMFQFYRPNVQSSIRHPPPPPPPCSQCILFGDNGSHWKHIVHDWVITWSLVVYLSAGATTPGEQASQLTPCAKCIVLWAAHQITRLIGSFVQRTACGFNTFRCWYTLCVCVCVWRTLLPTHIRNVFQGVNKTEYHDTTQKVECAEHMLHSFIILSALRQVYAFFLSEFSTECDLVFPLSTFSIFYFL